MARRYSWFKTPTDIIDDTGLASSLTGSSGI